jgi:hypothetical protein
LSVIIDGTSGITTPGVVNSGSQTIASTLQVGGITTNVYPLVAGTAVASTSGTSIDFTSIPSWVKRITVMFSNVSTNGTSIIQIQIGSGSFLTTGYVSNAFGATASVILGTVNSTTGLLVSSANVAGATWYGSLTLTLLSSSSNIWTSTGAIGRGDIAQGYVSSGGNTLSGTLDRVRITTVNGTDTFDAGSINILYE